MTQKLLVSIFDKKSNHYLGINLCFTKLEAIRQFETLVNDPNQSVINKYPDDFELHSLATFDEITGVITPEKTLIITGKDCFKNLQENI